MGQPQIFSKLSFELIIYGPLSALTYLFMTKASKSPAEITCMVSFLASIGILRNTTFPGIKREFLSIRIIRPVLFAMSQFLIVKALANNPLFSTFLVAAAGTLFTAFLGKLILGETPTALELLGLVVGLSGILLLSNVSEQFSLLSLLAGLFQGLGAIASRFHSIKGGRTQDLAFANLTILGIIMIPFSTNPVTLSLSSTLMACIAGILSASLQKTYFSLANKIPAWKLSLIGFSRIPAAYLLAPLFNNNKLNLAQALPMLIVLAGLLISYAPKTILARRIKI